MRSNIITVRTEGENVRPTLGPHLAAHRQFLLPPRPQPANGDGYRVAVETSDHGPPEQLLEDNVVPRGRYCGCLHLANEETGLRTGALLAQVTA